MQQGRLPSRFLLSSQQPSMMALSLPLLYPSSLERPRHLLGSSRAWQCTHVV